MEQWQRSLLALGLAWAPGERATADQVAASLKERMLVGPGYETEVQVNPDRQLRDSQGSPTVPASSRRRDTSVEERYPLQLGHNPVREVLERPLPKGDTCKCSGGWDTLTLEARMHITICCCR